MPAVTEEKPSTGTPADTEQAQTTEAPLAKQPEAPSAKIGKPVTKSSPELSTRILIVAIDAGHGGEDPGAHGRGGTFEKNVTLAIARKLKALMDDTQGMRGLLIRDGDYFVPLGGRVAKARQAHADLFVSIHADAYIKPDARGSSVFALSDHGATSAAARWLAKKENEADLIGGVNIAVKDPYLARTLLDLSQTATITDSLKLGKHVLGELGSMNMLHRGFVEQAGFAVLKSPDIPSILVETAFISNPAEEVRLNDEGYQEKLARSILAGIKRYFAQNPALSRQRIAQNEGQAGNTPVER
jgi:N-acetylmuramoyl-L-alanine amidase